MMKAKDKENVKPAWVNQIDGKQSSSAETRKKQQQKKKRVGFVEPTEILTFARDEAPELNLGNVMSRTVVGSQTAVQQVTRSSKIIEEILEWDDEDDLACFSLHDLQLEVKITRDTEKMSVSELRRELQARGQPVTGTKAQLVKRLDQVIRESEECV